MTEDATEPQIGSRVVTRDGRGTVVGWHSSRTWLDGRLEVRAFLIVRLDGGGHRLYRTAEAVQDREASAS
jgi:hypothetical protein